MVNSKLDNTINYTEMKKIRPQDSEMDAEVYSYTINDIPLFIAISNLDNTFIDKGIYYITIYLVFNNEVISQIGVFEFLSTEYPNIIDNENEIDLEKLDEPLLYSFITDDFLRKYETLIEEVESEGEEEQEEEEENVFNKPQETVYEELTEKEIKSYIQEDEELTDTELDIDEDNWFQKFMKNKNYGIVDNEGGGECLFAVIRDAFKGYGKKVSIAKMRSIIAENVTETIFREYKDLYDQYKNNERETINKSKNIVKEFKDKNAIMQLEESSDRKKEIQNELIQLKNENNKLKVELSTTRENLNDVKIMEGVNTIEDFKEIIKTCTFWADVWAISTLEKILKIKLVIFNSSNFEYGDKDNVLQCGIIPQEEMKVFEPKYYILAEHTGNHYKLITYDEKSIFTYNEMPKNIKKLIVTKCMERKDGFFNIIPEFKRFNDKLKSKDVLNLEGTKETEKSEKQQGEEDKTYIGETLYDKNEATTFQFYSKSTGKPKPGKGVGEIIKPEYESKYKTLTTIKDWRKQLSNVDMKPFSLDGYTWNSVEHYYQANKFKRNNPEFYKKFTVESGTEISKDPTMAKGAGEKTGKYKKVQIRPKEVKVDFDFFENNNDNMVMENAMKAKFSQNEDSKRVLLETKYAKLNHFSRGSPPVVFNNLMRVRNELK